ncbi:hypothetical protein BH10ACT11_BH10ACT11_14230 [soil metagenome]
MLSGLARLWSNFLHTNFTLFANFDTDIGPVERVNCLLSAIGRLFFLADSGFAGAPRKGAGLRMRTGMTIGTKSRASTTAGINPEWDARVSRLYGDFRRPASGMIRRAFGSTFSDSEIEDFYSAAWLGTFRALAKRHEGLRDDEIKSYLLTAVANHAGKEIRRRKRKPIAPLDDAASVVPDSASTPEESFSVHEESQITRDVLSSLPPRRRAVMLLRYGLDLEPNEVCGLVKGLSHRAYRKEISRGVDEMATKMRQVEAGEWCDERESVLKAYAAGMADGDQAQQAEKHMAHCKQCTEFVGRLSGHLHDLGSAIAVPGALDSLDGHVSIPDRLGQLIDRARGGTSGGSATEVVNAASTVRGTGAVGGGLVAKFAALGGAGKLAAACLTGGLAATACVAAGIAPISLERKPEPAKAVVVRPNPKADRADAKHRQMAPPAVEVEPNPQPEPPPTPPAQEAPTAATATPGAAATPPETQIVQPPPAASVTGLAPAASIGADTSSSGGDSGSSQAQQNAQQEFGP